MKKEFISIIALCASLSAYGTEYTIQPNGTVSSTTLNTAGWSAVLQTTQTTDGYVNNYTQSATLPGTVYLTSIQVTVSADTTSLVKLAVYEFNNPATSNANYVGNSQVGNFLGVSGTGSLSGTAMTFSFDGVELSSAGNYIYLLVESSATATSLDGATDSEDWTKYRAAASSLAVYTETSGIGSNSYNQECIYQPWASSAATTLKSQTRGSTADAIYTVTDNIPEPATATLSLLALAGLASRRRRK